MILILHHTDSKIMSRKVNVLSNHSCLGRNETPVDGIAVTDMSTHHWTSWHQPQQGLS